MKKGFYILGFGTLLGSLYLYFKKQLELALSYEYDVKSWKIIKLDTKEVEAEITIQLVNKSAFKIEVLSYDLNLFYKSTQFARTFSTESFLISPNTSVDVKTTTNIEFKSLKTALLPFFLDVLQKKPINISVDGHVKVKFMGINYTIVFNKDNYQYSSDLLTENGLADDWEKLKQKIPLLKKI